MRLRGGRGSFCRRSEVAIQEEGAQCAALLEKDGIGIEDVALLGEEVKFGGSPPLYGVPRTAAVPAGLRRLGHRSRS